MSHWGFFYYFVYHRTFKAQMATIIQQRWGLRAPPKPRFRPSLVARPFAWVLVCCNPLPHTPSLLPSLCLLGTLGRSRARCAPVSATTALSLIASAPMQRYRLMMKNRWEHRAATNIQRIYRGHVARVLKVVLVLLAVPLCPLLKHPRPRLRPHGGPSLSTPLELPALHLLCLSRPASPPRRRYCSTGGTR